MKNLKFISFIYLISSLSASTLTESELTNDLTSNSPFMPYREPKKSEAVNSKPPAPSELEQNLEFKGICDFGDDFLFGLYDKKQKKSFWVKKDENLESVGRVMSYDPSRKVLTLLKDDEYLDLVFTEPNSEEIPLHYTDKKGSANDSTQFPFFSAQELAEVERLLNPQQQQIQNPQSQQNPTKTLNNNNLVQ